MKDYKIRRTNGEPTQWAACGETPESTLANWEACFGSGFEVVGHQAKVVTR